MSEKLNRSIEHGQDNLDLSIEVEKSLKRSEKAAETAGGEQPETVEIKQKVEQQAISGKEITIGEKEAGAAQEFGVYTQMKSQTYGRTMGRIRGRLSLPDRAMSKIMHNRAVEAVSDGLSKTAARPSGILGGGIAALIGSLILLYTTKYYGFEYNFFVYFILLGGGFVLGVLAELLIRTIAHLRR